MIITITANNFTTNSNCSVVIDEITECPMCKHAIKPVQLGARIYDFSNFQKKLSINYLCKSCNDSFVVQYENLKLQTQNGTLYESSTLDYIAPIHFIPEEFDELIKNSFENFIKIYNQAFNAENLKLDEIAGIGYRKALEFLIKDFLIMKTPDKRGSIEKTALGACINNFIDNPQLKTASLRAAWLGNDQTHYIQKFTDKDINDLKRLIRLTVHWISMILETDEAENIEPVK